MLRFLGITFAISAAMFVLDIAALASRSMRLELLMLAWQQLAAVGLALSGAAIARRASPLCLCALLGAGFSTFSAVQMAGLRQDPPSMAVALVVLAIGAAVLLPWGPGWQAALVCVVLAVVGIGGSWLGVALTLLLSVFLAVLMMASVYIAYVAAGSRRELGLLQASLHEELERAETSRRELGARIREQTRDLETTADELAEFCHAASHDIRPPLRTMAGYAQMVSEQAEGEGDGETARAVYRVVPLAKRMGLAIDALLEGVRSMHRSMAASLEPQGAAAGDSREESAGEAVEPAAAFAEPGGQLVAVRARRGLQLILAATLVPLLTDLPLVHPNRTILLAADVGRFLVVAGVYLAVARSPSPRGAVYGIWGASVFLVAQGWFGTVFRGEANGMISLIVGTGLCTSLAAFVPWGWRLHLGLVFTTLVEFAWEYQWHTARHDVTTTAFLLAALCAVASLPLAWMMGREELAKSSARAGLYRAKELAESLARELAVRVHRRSQLLESATEQLLESCASLEKSLRSSLREATSHMQAASSATGDADNRALLHRMEAAAARMSATLDALLGYVDLSRRPLAFEEVDVSEAARIVLADLQRSEPARRVEVEVEAGVRLWGDRALLEEATSRLLENAWKFTGDSEAPRIAVEKWTRDDGYGGIRVHDNGIGVDPRFAEKLFRPFERLLDVEEYPGLGISLARVKRIVSRHGGLVRGGSSSDGGAEFGFVLPTRAREAATG